MISTNIETYCLSQKTAETISMKKSGVTPISGDYLHFCCLIKGESVMLPPFIYIALLLLSTLRMLTSTCLLFFYRVAGESDTEFLKDFSVDLAEHHRGVHLATIELGELLKGATAVVVGSAE